MKKPITDTLRHIGGGIFMDTASDQLAELVQAVETSGKAGKIVLEIAVKKTTRSGAMTLTGKIRLVKPPEEPMETLLWATPEGNLLSEDPNQRTLDLKRVPTAPKAELKTATQGS
ncbi:MAG: hypothetical protein FWD77_01440 [Betaproteobacteria bacterium]|nr:hypothetical protein [Betaproteobacteria bacterium]